MKIELGFRRRFTKFACANKRRHLILWKHLKAAQRGGASDRVRRLQALSDRSYSPPHNEPVGTRNHPQHAPNLKNAPERTRMLLNFNSIRALELSVE